MKITPGNSSWLFACVIVLWNMFVFFLFVFFQIYQCQCFNLTLLHTNDVHGRFEETDKKGFPCDRKVERTCYGGIARIATVVKEVRQDQSNVVLVDGGDRFTGTLWSDVYKGNATTEFFNVINYTAVTLGNHDFDYGPKILFESFLEKINCPVVVSNIDTSQDPFLNTSVSLIRSTLVVDVSGERIGFVGYVLPETENISNPGANVKFHSIVNAVQEAVNKLVSQNVNKIIAVGHAGIQVDKQVAKKVVGVDIVVGGHSNTFLYTGDPPSDDNCQGPYPLVIHPDHNKTLNVLVVQAYYYTKYLGNLQVSFNDEGEVIYWSGNPVLLNSSVSKDESVENLVEKMKQLVDKKGNKKIGQTDRKLSGTGCFKDPCNFVPMPWKQGCESCLLGDLVTSAMLYEFRQYIATIALFSSYGIRKSLPTDAQGYVLYKDLFASFPYLNTIDMIELTGADLKRSLEVAGRLQIKGLQFQYSSAKKRVVEDLRIMQPHCTSDKCYMAVNMSKIYKVVSDSYYVTTSNRVVANKGRNRVRGNSIYDVLVTYFQAKYPIGNNVNGARKLSFNFVILVCVCTVIQSVVNFS